MTDSLSDIVEIVECRLFEANYYLQRGYKLLGWQSISSTSKHPNGEFFVRRGFLHILGRPSSVEKAPLPPRKDSYVKD